MRRIVVSEFVTLDGIIEAPNEWSMSYWNDDIGQFKYEELFEAEALLLGRATYEDFAAAWPNMVEETGEFGVRMNGIQKFVVSTTLDQAEWTNSIALRDLDEVAKLKEQPGKGLIVYTHSNVERINQYYQLACGIRLISYPGNNFYQGA